MTRSHALARLIWPLCAATLLLSLGFAPPPRPAQAAAQKPGVSSVVASTLAETEPNNTTSQANIVSQGTTEDWESQITGKIGTSDDLDYYTFTLNQPASSVKITLMDLPADYDLILAADPDTHIDQGSTGIEDITNIGGSIASIGGSIASIGGSIASIGGSIASIGGSIASIGGSIASIGGSIASISDNTGTNDENIETDLWQPGTYYVAVGSANGGYSDTETYTLVIEVTGSGLTKPAQDAPTVEMRIPTPTYNVTTLYIINSTWMQSLYQSNTTQIASIIQQLNTLATTPLNFGNGSEYGYVIDLADLHEFNGGSSISQIYNEWMANPENPFYANKVARLVDNVIKAASDPKRQDATSCPADPPTEVSCADPTMYYGNLANPNNDAPFTKVENIVLVGGDNVLPFFRLPDLTTVANEADYATYLASLDSKGIIDSSKPQGAALKRRMVLSDNPYGTDKPMRFQGFPLYAPNRAIGRLVESPEDILRYLNRWSYLNTYTIDLRSVQEVTPKAYVNGYDFLKDQATAISQTLMLGLSGNITAKITGPINETWTRNDLEDSWFNGDLTRSGSIIGTGIFSTTVVNDSYASHANKLFSLNSHFDHWQILPAKNTAGNFLARRIIDPSYNSTIPGGYFGGTLGYSVGCHSGYDVIDSWLTLTNNSDQWIYRADFAQAFNKQAGNWIGNTGYGYGTADGIDYSERLALLLTEELMRDARVEVSADIFSYVGMPIGSALAHAKQRYLRNSASLSVYDAKALTVMTFYGLPFIHVLVDNPLAPPPEEPQIGTGSSQAPTESTAPDGLPVNSVGRLERTITVTIDLKPSNYVTLPRTGSKLLQLSDEDISITDSFVEAGFVTPMLRIFDNSQAGLPSLPTFAYDISALNSSGSDRLKVNDVVFLSGEYAPGIPFNPQITQVVTETESPIVNTDDEPGFTAGAGIWYPDKFFGFSSIGSDNTQRDQLTVTAAQFKANTDGETGLLRGYTQMVFKVYYLDSDKATPTAEDDEQAPVIQSVQISQITTARSLAATDGMTVVANIENGTG
ncbi:MAG: peptidase, partial [Oscillochloris sp.]|nr:peptidase [Oscillochloris sp.]